MPADKELIERLLRAAADGYGECHYIVPEILEQAAARLEALTRPLEGETHAALSVEPDRSGRDRDARRTSTEGVDLAAPAGPRSAITRPLEGVEAVEPFLTLAREVINPANGERPWHADSEDWMVVFSFAGQSLTLGDLRRAAALSPSPEAQPEPVATEIEKVLRRATIDYQQGAAAPGVGIHEFSAKRVAAFLGSAPSCDTGKIGREEVAALINSHIRLEWHGHDHASLNYRSIVATAEAILSLLSVRVGGGEEEEGSSRSQPVLSPKSDTEAVCAICGGSEIVALGNGQYDDCACAEGAGAALEKDWPISTDGHHSISNIRRWMARQLMDSGLSEEEALGVVAYHPAITDLSSASLSPDQHSAGGEG